MLKYQLQLILCEEKTWLRRGTVLDPAVVFEKS